MALQIQHTNSEAAMSSRKAGSARKLLRAIATDVHFWIPFGVLLGGLLLLDRLR
jgi:hypothetical protein